MKLQTQSIAGRKNTGVLSTGLALFSMFFGAGNLIFPLLIGKSAGQTIWYALSGMGLTAVLMPFLGIAAMVLFQGDIHRFFGGLGKIPSILLILLLQLILGPFGVIPRLVSLMHATATSYLFDLPLLPFSVLIAIAIFGFGCSFKRKRLISFLATYLTPILLLSLATLIFVGLMNAPSSIPIAATSGKQSFLNGLVEGYNMMDLIAAFLFATVILPHFQNDIANGQKMILKKVFLSGLIAAGLLFVTYIGLSFTSLYHSGTLDSSCLPEQMLGAIAIQLLGPIGGCIAVITISTACLTTAISLTSIFSDYLRKDICKDKINPLSSLIITLVITTLFANLGFGGIKAFLTPIVEIVYPGLIILTLQNLLHSIFGYPRMKVPILLVFIGSAIMYAVQNWF